MKAVCVFAYWWVACVLARDEERQTCRSDERFTTSLDKEVHINMKHGVSKDTVLIHVLFTPLPPSSYTLLLLISFLTFVLRIFLTPIKPQSC